MEIDENIDVDKILEESQAVIDEQEALIAEPESVETEEVIEEKPRELTDKERRAARLGWKPEGVEGKPNKTADEFLEYHERYEQSKARRLEKEIEEQRRVIKQLQESMYGDKKAAIQNRINEAVEYGDKEAYNKLVSDLESLDNNHKASVIKDVPKAVSDWMDRNPWFNSSDPDDVLKAADADAIMGTIEARMPDATDAERFAVLDAALERKYGSTKPVHRLAVNPNTLTAPSTPDHKPVNTTATKSASAVLKGMSFEQRQIVEDYVRATGADPKDVALDLQQNGLI